MEKISMETRDLKWIAQSVHNAYHNPPEGKGGHWDSCEKSVCNFVQQLVSGKVFGTEIIKGKLNEV